MRRMVPVAVAVVLGATLAAAAPDHPTFRVVPTVTVMTLQVGQGGSGSAMFRNDGGTAVVVDQIIADPSCEPGATMMAAVPFTVPGFGSGGTITYQCQPSTPGMRSCIWHVLSAGSAVADYELVCQSAGMPSLAPSTTTGVDFGTVIVGGRAQQLVTLTNLSPTSITQLHFHTTDIHSNFVIGAPCNQDARACTGSVSNFGPAQTQTFSVSCAPKQAGTLMADLYIASDSGQALSTTLIPLRCDGAAAISPVIAVSPATVGPFEVEARGTASATATVTIQNISTSPGVLEIQSVLVTDNVTGAALDWSYTASGACSGSFPPSCSLAAGQQLELDVRFDPGALDSRDAQLLINYRDTSNKSLIVELRGRGLGGTLELIGGTSMIDFGVVPVTISSAVTFQLANRGNRELTATLGVDPSGVPFSLMPSPTALVTPAAATTVTATCRPSAPGSFSTTFRASAADAFASTPIAIPAQCQGTTAGLHGDPTTIALGELRRGTMVPARAVTIMGVAGSIALASAELEAANANLSVTPLTGNQTPATIELQIEAVTDGDLAPNGIIVTPTSGATLRIPISGTIVTASYDVPPEISLGTFCVNQPTAATGVRLTSTGTATIGLSAPTMEQPDSPFDLRFASPSAYDAMLPPLRVATVEITPRRQRLPGTQVDRVVWTTDVEQQRSANTTVTADFVDEGAAAAPNTLEFGSVPLHRLTMNAQTITLQNCEDTELELAAPEIDAPFTIDSPNFPTTLMPSESATFSVGFHPTTLGRYQQTMLITFRTAEVAPIPIVLVGEGITGDGDGDGDDQAPDRTSFYACSGCASHGPTGAGALLVAFAVALRPRRRRGSRLSGPRRSGSS